MSINRRDFLKFAAATGSALALSLGPKNVGSKSNDVLSAMDEISTTASIFVEKGPSITTIDAATTEIKKSLENLPNIFTGRIMMTDGSDTKGVWMGEKEDNFIPASILKVAICNEIYKTNPELINSDNMAKILGKGDPSYELVMSTPIAKELKTDRSEPVIRKILEGNGVELQSPSGDDNLQVNFDDYFNYLSSEQLPPVMLDAMRQGLVDNDSNRFVSAILSKYINLNETPVSFKIGISSFTHGSHEASIVSYIFKSRDLTVLGYTTGTNFISTDLQLLATADVLGRYLQSKSEK